jgi:hypothetical protein
MSKILSFVASVALVVGIGSIAACESVSEEQKEQIQNQNDAADRGFPALSNSEGEASVFDLRQGDCISSPVFGEFATVEIVPCYSSAATAQVTSLFLVTANGSYPGVSYFDDQYVLYCDIRATSYIGPTSESWAAGDRTMTCMEDL